jgi:hypothetical protein
MDAVVYRPIEGFSGYRVGDDGSVWGCRKYTGNPLGVWRQLKYWPDAHGYLQVNLYRDHKSHIKKVHQLVLRAFVGPCPPNMECCHFNAVKSDNRLDNLKWGTRVENISDRVRHGTLVCGEKSPRSKLTSDQVKEIRRIYARGGRSLKELANQYGLLNGESIRAIVNCVNWKHVI